MKRGFNFVPKRYGLTFHFSFKDLLHIFFSSVSKNDCLVIFSYRVLVTDTLFWSSNEKLIGNEAPI